jgi:UDP-N-acetylglucosamine acyltransferase
MSSIHATAIVGTKAQIAEDVEIGPYSVIDDNVVIGAGTVIGSSVKLADGAVIGQNVRISHGAVIGTMPQDLKFGGEKTKAIIGDNTVVREYVTVNRGTKAHGETSVGKNCMLMAYSHVAHDCVIGDSVIMANSVNLAGHIEIDDYAILGGVLPVHQFVKIGAHCMIGGGFRVQQDICPYSLVGGYPLRVVGINSIGLRRRGFPPETIGSLEKAFKILFFGGLNTTQALEAIKDGLEITPEIQQILTFFSRSTRGVVK